LLPPFNANVNSGVSANPKGEKATSKTWVPVPD